jgi:DNA-binding response OmpR family regulator
MIIDLKMPGMDGIQVLQQVKQTHPLIRIIVLTGHGSDQDRKTCMDLGASAYFQKPIDIDELNAAIHQIHENARPDPASPTDIDRPSDTGCHRT